jgi:2,4'-dihydroxyacetophenone dioxygenase
VIDIAKELEKTLHIHSEEIPYIPAAPDMEIRILHARAKDDFYVTQLRAQPGCVSGLHRHPFNKGTGGFTLKGSWGHDHQYLYRPGTYIFETPGVIHQFLNGPEETEVVFFGDLAAEFVDPETLEITGIVNAEAIINKYLEHCEDRGIRPHFLK